MQWEISIKRDGDGYLVSNPDCSDYGDRRHDRLSSAMEDAADRYHYYEFVAYHKIPDQKPYTTTVVAHGVDITASDLLRSL